MKKYIVLLPLLFIFVGFHLPAAHAEMPVGCNDPSAPSYPEYYTQCVSGSGGGGGSTAINANSYYVSYLDQYRMDYGRVTGSNNYKLHFVAANGTVYNADYNFNPTGTHYLTCNGRYSLLFYNGSSLIASTNEVITTAIINPTCSSYADGVTGKDDLAASMTGDKITWQPVANADKYEVYKDGQKINETTGTEYTPTADGSYSVVAKDAAGSILGQSDINVKTATPTTPPTTCDTCQKLSELLACPDWDNYMGDLTNAIKAAIPPPPNWDDVADKIGNSVITKLDQYMGQVPAIPTINDINQSNPQPALPTLDNSSQAQDLTPNVPSDFNQPIENDLESAPVIPIEDHSKPFTLTDPLSNLQYDDPNIPVFPKDPRNNSGGIDAPTSINEPAPTPHTVAADPSSSPIQNAPSVAIPTPATSGTGAAIPSGSSGTIPIPSYIP